MLVASELKTKTISIYNLGSILIIKNIYVLKQQNIKDKWKEIYKKAQFVHRI